LPPAFLLPQDGDINPFTLRPFTATYKKILEGRKKLPVYERMHEFYELVSPPPPSLDLLTTTFLAPRLHAETNLIRTQFSNNQILVMVGETGSGKTTQ